MNKNISFEEKLEFYEKFNEKEFNEKFRKIGKVPFWIGFISLKVLTLGSVIGGIFNPVLFLGMIPAVAIPSICMFVDYCNRKAAIESLTKNVTYKDYKEMMKTDEFVKIKYEKSARQMKINHYAKESDSQIIVNKEKLENRPRAVEACIFKAEELNEETKSNDI